MAKKKKDRKFIQKATDKTSPREPSPQRAEINMANKKVPSKAAEQQRAADVARYQSRYRTRRKVGRRY